MSFSRIKPAYLVFGLPLTAKGAVTYLLQSLSAVRSDLTTTRNKLYYDKEVSRVFLFCFVNVSAIIQTFLIQLLWKMEKQITSIHSVVRELQFILQCYC